MSGGKVKKVLDEMKHAPYMGEGDSRKAYFTRNFTSPFDMIAKSRAFLVVTFDVTSGKPVFKDAYVTTQHPKPTLGLLYMYHLECKATSPGIAIREIYRRIESEEGWAWVRPYLKVKR